MSEQEPGHPLFLTEDSDDDPVSVSEIQIARVENGQQVFYPRLFPANELQSLEQVAAELGGGSYILIARHEGRITTRRKYVLPGKPKPMYDESRQEPTTPQVSAPVASPVMGPGEGMVPFFMMMMQQQNQAADRQMQLVIAMMQSSREASTEDKATARAEMQANLERDRIASEKQMMMMREMMQLAQSGNKSEGGEFYKGVEFMRTFAAQQIDVLKAQSKGEDTDWGSILETVGQAIQGLNMFKQVQQGGLPEGIPDVAEAAQ